MLQTELIAFIRKTGKAFKWNDEGLRNYLNWAFSRDFLFMAEDSSGITGVMVAYTIPTSYNGNPETLLPSDAETLKKESELDICLMDAVFTSHEARVKIAKDFCNRFPNWKNQKKWALRRKGAQVVELKNRFITLTEKL